MAPEADIPGNARDVLAKLQSDEALMGVPSAKAGLDDMALLFDFLDVYGITNKMSFDMSLARGLDYYTGIIYEAVTDGSAPPSKDTAAVPEKAAEEADKKADAKKDKKAKKGGNANVNEDGVDESAVGVGSIAAGGRYDNLVGMFAEAAGSKRSNVPCVGVSIGVERVYAILNARQNQAKARSKETDVFVLALGGGLLPERMKFAKMLWDAGIKAEFSFKNKPKAPQQWAQADSDGVKFVAILAPSELEKGTVRIKEQGVEREAGQDNGEEVKMEDVVKYLKERL